MIHKLVLKNFKKIKEEIFLFSPFDLIVGANNSGKSTALQAMAIWQFCVDQFRLSGKKGSRGIQIVLPNFTALPLPEFNLLWTDRTDREYKNDNSKKGGKALMYVYIEVDVYWKSNDGKEKNFCVQMRYHSPQSVYAIPKRGWKDFQELDDTGKMPRIVYVPPFSGLEPHEKWMDDGNVRQNVGKAQPGSVLRNLLYRVIDRKGISIEDNIEWKKIVEKTHDWFGVKLLPPQYEKGISTEIIVEFKSNKKTFDIISGGSGFHQILTLMAFLFGYPEATTILFDEPDAHLHVNLQRKIINFLKLHSQTQFIIATHSEEFIKGVEINSILSILPGKPTRVETNRFIISALSEIDNIDVVRTQESPFILYVEGEDDERILSAWASILGKTEILQKYYVYPLGGPNKNEMKRKADNHFKALKEIVPELKRAILLDKDLEPLNPDPTQPVLNEWRRKNIDNYLLVPDAWKRSVAVEMNQDVNSLFLSPFFEIIDQFFIGQNLTLPPNSQWKNIKAQIFSIVDGKELLFENEDSLFQQIKNISDNQLKINRTTVATSMQKFEIHEDVEIFFFNLEKLLAE
jgi:predicted ATPase